MSRLYQLLTTCYLSVLCIVLRCIPSGRANECDIFSFMQSVIYWPSTYWGFEEVSLSSILHPFPAYFILLSLSPSPLCCSFFLYLDTWLWHHPSLPPLFFYTRDELWVSIGGVHSLFVPACWMSLLVMTAKFLFIWLLSNNCKCNGHYFLCAWQLAYTLNHCLYQPLFSRSTTM